MYFKLKHANSSNYIHTCTYWLSIQQNQLNFLIIKPIHVLDHYSNLNSQDDNSKFMNYSPRGLNLPIYSKFLSLILKFFTNLSQTFNSLHYLPQTQLSHTQEPKISQNESKGERLSAYGLLYSPISQNY